jgi:raffinose/stachyose/melibiose transport system permease protein
MNQSSMTDLTASSVQSADVVPARSRFPVHIAVFLAPALVIYSLFSIYPLFDTIRLSLYAGDETGARSFVGLQKFYTLLTDPNWSVQFWNAFTNNLIFF